jgi:hypothetical protein
MDPAEIQPSFLKPTAELELAPFSTILESASQFTENKASEDKDF